MPANITAAERPILQYGTLAVLLAAALVFHVRSTMYRYPTWFGEHEMVAYPFVVLPDDERPELVTYLIQPIPGLQNREPILAIDGKPLTGTAVFGDALRRHKPGDLLQVTVLEQTKSGNTVQRVVEVPLKKAEGSVFWVPRFAALLLFVILPAFCLALGFSVAAIRPRDGRAWLLLGMMLSFAGLFNPFAESWGPVLRDYGAFYGHLMAGCLPIWLLLFGLYFPERFPRTGRWRWLSLLVWLLVASAAVSDIGDLILNVGAVENFASVTFVYGLVHPVEGLLRRLYEAAAPVFFVCLALKFRFAQSRDARRRLRLLFVGAALSLTPVLSLNIAASFLHVSAEQYFPEWLTLSAWLMFFLFPLTLAYVIVVHRAMNVRVVLRQGLKYALAQSSIRIIRVALAVVLWSAIVSAANNAGQGSHIASLIILAAGGLLWFTVRRLIEALGAWTDRHFFREAYNAEQLLAELGETVRSIVETEPLLATVADRISQSMHVPRIAVLLDGSGPYLPAYALGYEPAPTVVFPENAATVRQLREEREPARVYFDDPNSWVYTNSGMTDEERRRLAELQPELLLPLSGKDKLSGFISLSQKLSEEPYSPNDVRLLQSVAAQTGLALEIARLTTAIGEEIAQRERLNREVEIAREVQERLFPQELPSVAGLDYYGACRPALGVGGDYYDFLALPGNRLGIALGDVSGKGIAAALMMASLQASLRAEASRGTDDLASVIGKVNRLLYDASTANRYATFFYAQYDAPSRRLTYVNAGHNPPLLFRAGDGGEPTRLEKGGTVIGLLKDSAYSQETVALNAGDVLIVYTDGISETMTVADEEWGEENLIETVRKCDSLSARETITRIMEAADRFASGAKQHDDMTISVLRVMAAGPVS
ncbi:MAG TPA: SpoIIE family protein phosphatase [Bryobacteraceae bacterium]|nr:SpoIIE family protein phosphatase [Bryobacteraceae bacterium]